MRIVAFERNVIEGEVEDGFHIWVEFQRGKGTWLAGELEAGLVEVILIEMEIAKRVDEVAGFVIANLRNHMGEERVGSDVERHTQEQIRAALIELAGEPRLAAVFGFVNVELKQQVARRKSHAIQIANVPCGDDMAT